MTLLEKYYQSEMELISKPMRAFPWENKDIYANWLAQTYWFVRHSTRLLALCAAWSNFDQQSLHLRFAEHVGEEKNHEVLLARDLHSLGYSIENMREFFDTSAFYQIQYYWVQHQDPASFFGYVLFLEGVSATVGEEIYAKVSKQYVEKATSFIRVHAEEDHGHIEKALSQISDLPEREVNLIVRNLTLSGHLYANILRECCSSNLNLGSKKAG